MGSDRFIWDWDSTSREHMLPWQCLMTKMLLTLADLRILFFFFKTIGYSNLLISENIIFTFEYFSIKDVLNQVIIGLHTLIISQNGLHLAEL